MKILFLWMIMILGNFVNAGEVSSGGGQAIVCRDQLGKIEKSQVLDLYEAERRGITIRQPSDNFEAEYSKQMLEMHRLTGEGPSELSDIAANLKDSFQKLYYFLPSGVRLKVVQDIGKTISPPKDCRLEQLAVYRDDQNRIDINSEIWKSLSVVDQVALMVHESVYRDYRTAGDKTSENSRVIVGRLFAREPLTSALESLPTDSWQCSAGFLGGLENQSRFFLYGVNANNSVLQFTQIFGKKTFSLLRVIVPAKIDPTKMVSDTGPSGPILNVTDKNANLHQVFEAENEIFAKQKVIVRYRFNEPFSIATLDSEGQLDKQAPIGFCQHQERGK
ncbi:MAG: hypothetical protein A4S09_07900 [Proteobacteria bacterium SG_bin7]|nr:MAG: hypothetical protein A4S09_07900 [Proteobacteria bacterium SG_bin7]